MKKILCIALMVLLFISNTLAAYAENNKSPVEIDASQRNEGVVKVGYLQATEKRIRLLVEKDGTRYSYNLYGKRVDNFPLQMGNGEYLIRVFENIEGNRYREIHREKIQVELKEEKRVFLNSIQEIKWDNNSQAIKKAKELTKGLKSHEEKVLEIYKYITQNIDYDYQKLDQLTYSYLPNIDDTLTTGKGICYDYASLFAAMLRGVGIPTKLVKGRGEEIEGYHAWNEVYLQELNTWVTMDTSYDAQMKDKEKGLRPYKAALHYSAEKIY